jgi:hypothetical protein
MSTAATSFFHVSGGNLPPEAPSYIVVTNFLVH